MSAVLADQELDPIVERMQALLGDGGLCLLDDIQRVWGAQAQCIDVAQWLQAAVWVHAIHQAICRRVREILERWGNMECCRLQSARTLSNAHNRETCIEKGMFP